MGTPSEECTSQSQPARHRRRLPAEPTQEGRPAWPVDEGVAGQVERGTRFDQGRSGRPREHLPWLPAASGRCRCLSRSGGEARASSSQVGLARHLTVSTFLTVQLVPNPWEPPAFGGRHTPGAPRNWAADPDRPPVFLWAHAHERHPGRNSRGHQFAACHRWRRDAGAALRSSVDFRNGRSCASLCLSRSNRSSIRAGGRPMCERVRRQSVVRPSQHGRRTPTQEHPQP